MKKAILGVGMALTAALLPNQEALAEPTTAMCGSVYEMGRASSPALQQQIGLYASLHEIEVHLQIFHDAEDEGIVDDADAEAYADKLAEKCGWSDRSRVNVILAYDHGIARSTADDVLVLNVIEIGEADRLISERSKGRALDRLERKYVDKDNNLIPSDDYQADMAQFLADIEPGTSGPSESTPEPSEREPFDWPDIPVWPSVIVGLSATAIGLGSARFVHGRRLRRLHNYISAESNKAAGDVLMAEQEGRAVAGVLHEEDGSSLRANLQQVDGLLVALKESREALGAAYKSARRRWWWPQGRDVRLKALHASRIKTKAGAVAQLIKDDVDYVEGLKGDISGRHAEFQSLLGSVHQKAQNLKTDGWVLGTYDEEFERLREVEVVVSGQIKARLLEQPARTMEMEAQKADELLDNLYDLPERYNDLQTDIGGLDGENEGFAQELVKVEGTLNKIRETYDSSCYEDLGDIDVQMRAQMLDISKLTGAVQLYKGKKDVNAIQAAETTLAKILEQQVKLQDLVGKVRQRSTKLDYIKTELPNTIASKQSLLGAVSSLAEDADVSDGTRQAVQTVSEQLGTIVRTIGDTKQPRYLEIDATLTTMEKTILNLKTQANSEQQAAAARRRAERARNSSGDNDDSFGGGWKSRESSDGNRRSSGGSSRSSTTRRMGGGSSAIRKTSITRRFGGGK